MKPGHTHTHTHSYAYMYEHTEYVLYTGASMHEPVAAHTLTNIVELIAHTRLSFMGSNTIADMQQTVLMAAPCVCMSTKCSTTCKR